MQPDRKVYDSDIRVSQRLRDIAHMYADEYVGNFDMMIEAQAYYHVHGCLPEGMYRPVLNTLRTDSLAVDLWRMTQALLRPDVFPSSGWSQDEQADVIPMSRSRPPRDDVSARQKPNFIIFPDKPFRFSYGTTLHKAKHPVIHLMRDRCDVEWSRPPLTTDRWRGYDKDKPLSECKLLTNSYCARRHSGMRYWRHLPTIGEAWEGYASTDESEITPTLCRSCCNRYLDEHGEAYVIP